MCIVASAAVVWCACGKCISISVNEEMIIFIYVSTHISTRLSLSPEQMIYINLYLLEMAKQVVSHIMGKRFARHDGAVLHAVAQ